MYDLLSFTPGDCRYFIKLETQYQKKHELFLVRQQKNINQIKFSYITRKAQQKVSCIQLTLRQIFSYNQYNSHYTRFSPNLVTHLSDVESQSDQYSFSQLQQQLLKPHTTKQLGEPVRDLKQKPKSKIIQRPANDSHTFNAKTHPAIYSSSLPTNNAKPSKAVFLNIYFIFVLSGMVVL
ncbi:Hypothetical_protein [Hexamita inflata]|uniref:Hypothetical_protein n=1 Tax=Hexamita inflata TaxID=28002 RepID=A0ABP1LS05_9EUKA